MTFGEYQEQARRTQNPRLSMQERLAHALHGLASEVGEIHAMYQKVYQGHQISADGLIKEMGDVLWFLAELADVYGVGLADVAQINIDKLKARYPEGFSADRSINRNVEDI